MILQGHEIKLISFEMINSRALQVEEKKKQHDSRAIFHNQVLMSERLRLQRLHCPCSKLFIHPPLEVHHIFGGAMAREQRFMMRDLLDRRSETERKYLSSQHNKHK